MSGHLLPCFLPRSGDADWMRRPYDLSSTENRWAVLPLLLPYPRKGSGDSDQGDVRENGLDVFGRKFS